MKASLILSTREDALPGLEDVPFPQNESFDTFTICRPLSGKVQGHIKFVDDFKFPRYRSHYCDRDYHSAYHIASLGRVLQLSHKTSSNPFCVSLCSFGDSVGRPFSASQGRLGLRARNAQALGFFLHPNRRSLPTKRCQAQQIPQAHLPVYGFTAQILLSTDFYRKSRLWMVRLKKGVSLFFSSSPVLII